MVNVVSDFKYFMISKQKEEHQSFSHKNYPTFVFVHYYYSLYFDIVFLYRISYREDINIIL